MTMFCFVISEGLHKKKPRVINSGLLVFVNMKIIHIDTASRAYEGNTQVKTIMRGDGGREGRLKVYATIRKERHSDNDNIKSVVEPQLRHFMNVTKTVAHVFVYSCYHSIKT